MMGEEMENIIISRMGFKFLFLFVKSCWPCFVLFIHEFELNLLSKMSYKFNWSDEFYSIYWVWTSQVNSAHEVEESDNKERKIVSVLQCMLAFYVYVLFHFLILI